jgi:aminomethyltransferase
MGQAELAGPDFETVAVALETLVPADIVGLPPGRQRYTQLTTDDGGIIDDLMVSRPPIEEGGDWRLHLVVNAARKHFDFTRIATKVPDEVAVKPLDDMAMIALQGPAAELVLSDLAPAVSAMSFLDVAMVEIDAVPTMVSRSGYTGEDGFEISVLASRSAHIWRRLTADHRVMPAGLGARDSLRLEAGLCLYGADISTTTTPVEASLGWSIDGRRRDEGGFPGAAVIRRELAHGPLRKRVGLYPEGAAPIRPGTPLFEDRTSERAVGYVTSGTLSPSLNVPVAMGYVTAPLSANGTALVAEVRGTRRPLSVAPMPFVPTHYKRNTSE